MPSEKRKIGDIGERVAANFLRNSGYEIIALNYTNSFGRALGEIDIIARENATAELVFVEVKTREFSKYSQTLPEENITATKLHKLQKIAQAYLRQKHLENTSYRFDAISVWLDQSTRMAKVRHLKSIFL